MIFASVADFSCKPRLCKLTAVLACDATWWLIVGVGLKCPLVALGILLYFGESSVAPLNRKSSNCAFHFIYFICPWAAAAAVIHSKNRVLHPRLTTVEQEYRCWSCTLSLEDASGSYRVLWGPNLVGRILPPDQVKDPAVDSETDFKKGIWSPCLYHLENNCDRYVGDEVWFSDLFFRSV